MVSILRTKSSNGNRIGKYKPRTNIWVIFVALILFASVAVISQFLKIRSVSINLDNVDCIDQKQIEKDLNLSGKYIFLLDKKEISNRLQKRFICISSIDLSIENLNHLNILVFGRKPQALIKSAVLKKSIDIFSIEASQSSQSAKGINFEFISASGSSEYLSDGDGFLFSKTEFLSNSNLLEISVLDEELKLGYKLSKNIVEKSFILLEQLKPLSLSFISLVVSNDSLFLKTDPKVVFSLKDDLDRQIASLQLILQKAKMNSDSTSKKDEQREIEMIDLRFDKPIIIYTPGKKSDG